MTMISAVSAEDRPYEKCRRAGAESLIDAELVAVIIRTGRRGASAVSLAENVLKLSGGFAGLTGLCHHSIPELMTIPGIGRVKAIQLQCVGELSRRIAKTRARELLAFPNADTIAGYYMEQLRHEEREHLIAMMLDSKNRMIGERTVSLGTVNAALLSPRELFLDALRCRAVSVILIHNHPSGDPTPSEEDLLITEKIRMGGELLDIHLLDHIVIGDRCYYSLREEGRLKYAGESDVQ